MIKTKIACAGLLVGLLTIHVSRESSAQAPKFPITPAEVKSPIGVLEF